MTTSPAGTHFISTALRAGQTATIAILCLPCCFAVAQLPGAGQLAMPGLITPAAPPEALEMWRNSSANPSSLIAYLDRPKLREALEAKGITGEHLRALAEHLELIAVRRLGDTGNASLIPRIESYVAERLAATEIDDAVIARLSVERIRLRTQGRDTYVQAMIRWVQALEPVRDAADPSVGGLEWEQKVKDAQGRVLEGSRALGVMKAAEGIPALIAKRGDEEWASPLRSFYLSRALARIGDPVALETLGQDLRYFDRRSPAVTNPLEPDEPDVAWAYWQMRTQGMNQEKAIDTLIWTVLNGPLHSRYSERVLELIGRPAVPALVAALGPQRLGIHPEAPQRLAAHVLGRLRAPEAVGALCSLLRTPGTGLHSVIAHALGQIGDRSAVPDLLDLTKHPNTGSMLSAISALGEIGDSAAEGRLLQIAKEEMNPNARYAAAQALAKFGTKATADEIERLLVLEPIEDVRAGMQVAVRKLRSK